MKKNAEVYGLMGDVYRDITNLIDMLEELDNKIKCFETELTPTLTYLPNSIEKLVIALKFFVIERAGIKYDKEENKEKC